ARDAVGDLGFQVHPVKAGDGRLAEEDLPLRFVAAPASAVLGPAYRRNHGARLRLEQAFEIGRLGQEIEPQLDELRAAFAGLLDLDLDHLVPRAADDDANHGFIAAIAASCPRSCAAR